MPVRTKDGVIHAVREHARSDYRGLTLCGLMYQTKRKGVSWAPLTYTSGPSVYRARPSHKRPTCIACWADMGKPH